MTTSINEMLEKARVAQQSFETYNQQQVDEIVRAIGKVVYDHAEELSRDAVEETQMGVFEDKVVKCTGKSRAIWNHLKSKKSVGIISRNENTGIVEVAKPMGVIGAVTPTTNPIVTPMCNAMLALKGRNAIIIAPHPRSKKCSSKTVALMNAEIRKLGGPEHLIQCIEEPSIEKTNQLMHSVDVVVATGGMGMVKAAYSSGKPSYGVGAGNVQVIIDREIDFDKAARDIIKGRKFDNGVICSGEQSIIVHQDDYPGVKEAFISNDTYFIEDQREADKLREVLFEDGHISKDVVGQSVFTIAELAGIKIPKRPRSS
ncbi:aldehyde dehydrogenase family protein [Dongshaea marina]|uniref:aldehyde dehydrogenase family protein n=1 Tax=Dongshaea marina TaxID=2047966 RepID=UPI00190282AC|nr:aldehyde dehydrogenase family protein [Dongshaea marina]